MDADSRVIKALEKLVTYLGADCDPQLPLPQADQNKSGARNTLAATQFDGTLTMTKAGVLDRDAEISVPGFVLIVEKTTEPVRVYFRPPTARGPYRRLEQSGWLKLRRGWESVWITADAVAGESVSPVITIATDPGFETGNSGCCDSGGGSADMTYLFASANDDISTNSISPVLMPGMTLTIVDPGDWYFAFNSFVFQQTAGLFSGSFHLQKNGISIAGADCFFGAGDVSDAALSPDPEPVGDSIPTVNISFVLTNLIAGDVIRITWEKGSDADVGAEDRSLFGLLLRQP
jgi:hypothetical protein